MTTIIGVKISNRLDDAIKFQKIITEFGCAIHTRIGLHKSDNRFCANSGIIILEVVDDSITTNLERELLKIENIEVQHMIFN